MAAGIGRAQQHEDLVDQVLQRGLVEQGLDVRALVVRGHQQRQVGLGAQGVAAVAGVAAGVAVHGVASMVRHAGSKNTKNSSDTDSNN